MQAYDNKQPAYFSNARTDILPLLPAFSDKVLEVGCGNGATLAWLKEKASCRHTTGIELLPEVGEAAKQRIDHTIIGNAEQLVSTLNGHTFQLVLLLDVLEHMVDPWSFMRRLMPLLDQGAVVLASIPNMRTAVVLSKLLFRGSFDYHDGAGIMDRTHLRWFTRKSASDLMNNEGLVVEHIIPSPNAPGSRSQLANTMTLGLFRDFFTEQFLIRSRKT